MRFEDAANAYTRAMTYVSGMKIPLKIDMLEVIMRVNGVSDVAEDMLRELQKKEQKGQLRILVPGPLIGSSVTLWHHRNQQRQKR